MKKHLWSYCLVFTLITLFFSFRPEEKYFEGRVDYKMEITAPAKYKDAAKGFQKFYGDQASFYFKKGNYKDEYNGQGMQQDYMDVDAGYYYMKINGSDTLQRLDAKKQADTVISITFKKAVKKIAGYTCNEVILKTVTLKTGDVATLKFYYCPDLKVNPEWFKTIKIASSNIVYASMKAIPLMYILDYGTHTSTITAVKVISGNIDDKEVKIPANSVFKDIK